MRLADIVRMGVSLIRRLWAVAFIRFLIVGALNTVFGYTVFAIFTLLGIHYVLAALLATVCGIIFNFNTTGRIVFKNKDRKLIFRFFGVYLVVYVVNVGLLKVFDIYNVNSLIAQAILALPLAVASFSLMRAFVFRSMDDVSGAK